MYLSHFGFSEQPFAHIPVTNFFYDGANRGATLDALIYVLTHGEGVEGIIKVTGEAGSGKTTLCRLLMKRLPPQMKTIYLAKPDLSRDELLHLIADELKSERAVSRTPVACATVTISDLENALIEKYAIGGQVILLIDEAHAIAAETLEELRLLYDLESARHKLLQIVLFGQTELEATLALPKMRQLKNRVTHHFAMQPFNAKAANDYLKLRMRAAGYRGPDIFSSEAIRLITMASGGLTQRINILADKSLLAAFNVNTRDIDAHRIKAVIKDSGIKRRPIWRDWSYFLSRRIAGATAVLAVIALGVLGWQALRSAQTNVIPPAASVPMEMTTSAPVSAPLYPPAVAMVVVPSALAPASASVSESRSTALSSPSSLPSPPEPVAGTIISAQGKLAASTEQHGMVKLDIGGVKLAGHKLLEQRVEATKQIMATMDKNYYSIQLFVTDNIQPDRMERFLIRAQNLVNLSDLYMHPVNNEGQAHFRVTYGIYSTRDQASAAMDELPQKYKTAFSPELYTLGELR
jgi:MSHA biogenesis protein MshM